jgi:hypothetical protein
MNVVTIDEDEPLELSPVAFLGAVCNPVDESELCPEPLAVLNGVLNDELDEEPVPEPLAVLIFV